MKGKFITVEGTEGVGKSTNMAFIEQWLQDAGKELVITREPGGTELGEKLRELLLDAKEQSMCDDTELLLMFAEFFNIFLTQIFHIQSTAKTQDYHFVTYFGTLVDSSFHRFWLAGCEM